MFFIVSWLEEARWKSYTQTMEQTVLELNLSSRELCEEWNKREFPKEFISLPDLSIKKPQLPTINFVYPFLPWSPVDVFPSSSKHTWLKPRQYLSFNHPQMCSHWKEQWLIKTVNVNRCVRRYLFTDRVGMTQVSLLGGRFVFFARFKLT